jgi:integral membrane sensor domain MASE1/two-component sensor histidine kinase
MSVDKIGADLTWARIAPSHLTGPVLLGLAYYLGAEAAFLIGTLSDQIFAPFWPPNAILFCALVLMPYRQWPLYIVAVVPAHILAEFSVGMGWQQLIVAFATNSMVALISATGVRGLMGPPPWLNTLQRAVSFVLVTAVFAPGIAALGGAFVRITGGGDLGSYWQYWTEWYVANALGSLTLGAMLLTWMGSKHDWSDFRSPLRRVEASFLLAGLGTACTIAFLAYPFAKSCYVPTLLYLPLPLVVWAAVRFQTIGASAAIFVITVGSIASILHGSTVFSGSNVEENVLALQLFLLVVSGSTLLLGASTEELRSAERTTARLARFVLGAQDAERRHVAKHLLDDVAQRLAAATWASNESGLSAAREETIQKSIRDLRELSYLLHPPMLEDAGLETALRSRLDSYSHCTGIAVTLEASGLGRLPADVELTIFRVVEEALANVKQHSGSVTAQVGVHRGLEGRDVVMLSIEDAGRGMPWMVNMGARIQRLTTTTAGWGLGLARMRERVRRMGGTLEITSARSRTTVRALIPIASEQAHRIT